MFYRVLAKNLWADMKSCNDQNELYLSSCLAMISTVEVYLTYANFLTIFSLIMLISVMLIKKVGFGPGQNLRILLGICHSWGRPPPPHPQKVPFFGILALNHKITP